MSDPWPLPDDVTCPRCGEDEYLMGVVNEMRCQTDTLTPEPVEIVVSADLVCGVGVEDGKVTGCGHTWTWTEGDS